ncbi:phenylalanyl-tRNA synthetase beta subunit [Halovivax ruber XH-70]|uniref:Phenylalanine--tRNA ligase beta subunit n=1 Tax=Halovivax ruber (strain DSM 18193 / JCM 13892 / XH-70) TaxID=797302 RepID=L0IEU8_HALRX|nr:phenylalanine--tRNA ligase beta subunit-related protein [Halovivax ruber]AGB17279.1 phenylalanyl-tRNA synthetase beta subunit [Halovivax ruber XH-70]
MPTVDIDPDELRTLADVTDVADDELKDDLFALGLEYEGETEDGDFELEFAPDRLDRLSVEGIARSLRYQYGEDRGVYVPTTTEADWTIRVDEAVPAERPYVTGAVIRGVDLDEESLDSLIQLQEKLHATMGRNRVKGAIGIHDLTMLRGAPATEGNPTIRYTGVAPDGERFVPLDSDRELTPGEVLEEHPTGREYAPVVDDYEAMPAIYDDIGLFSFPPVINGRRTEVSTDSRDLFVELTGTDQWTIDRMCAIICYALDARGATIEDVTVEYADPSVAAAAIEESDGRDEAGDSEAVENGRAEASEADTGSPVLVRPELSTKTKTVTHDRIESILGIELDPEEVQDLAERAGLEATVQDEADESTTGNGTDAESTGRLAYDVTIPPYRVDVLHPLDVIDDLGRAYGFNELAPNYPEIGTVGGRHERSRREEAVRETLVGLGFEDMLDFHLIGEADAYDRMGVDPGTDVLGGGEPARIKNPYSEDFGIVRPWALPSLLLVLENNTHRAYPQDLAEVGFVAEVDETAATGVAESRHVAGVLARHDAAYEDAKSRLQALCRAFDVDLETPPTDHPSFVDGRAASVVVDGNTVGVIGELHPAVLVEHDLEVPVAAFEFDLAGFGAE